MTRTTSGYTHDEGLRARLQAFTPDEPGVVFPFSARLARENGWTRAQARAMVEEYRRFVYLAMTAGHPVTPSVAVDQAWHLHLTYTRSYWDDLCGRVLGRPLHHDPTKGGSAEGSKFNDYYARTLESYRAAFGQDPPAGIWPSPGERFAAEARIRQVSDATHWVIRKPRLRRDLGMALAVLASALAVAGCAGSDDPFTWMVVGIIAVVVIFGNVTKPKTSGVRRRRGAGSGDGGGGLHVWGGDSCDDSGSCGDGGGDGGGSGCSGCGGCS